jgi:Fe-coproporphyrin III synthase
MVQCRNSNFGARRRLTLPHNVCSHRAVLMTRLPLVTLYLTECCNSRCISCDYWRHGIASLSLAEVEALLPELQAMGTEAVLISGGEPLLHADWRSIAALLRAAGLELWLLTSGVSLHKHADAVARLFDTVTVSLDGADAATYQRIRGLDAFRVVCDGVRRLTELRCDVSLRVTVQRDNYRQLGELVQFAHTLAVRQISFLAADVGNTVAFGRQAATASAISLQVDDLPVLAHELELLTDRYAADFASGFIAEDPAKLARILQYYQALHGLAAFPVVRCNAPEFSAVYTATGRVQPCFFIPGPAGLPAHRLAQNLLAPEMQQLRADIRCGARPECARCVCSMWREPGQELRDAQ